MRSVLRTLGSGWTTPSLATALLLSGACASRDLAGPDFAIQDAAHGSGNGHFFFLPPMVPPPTFGGAFDGSLAPVVEICRWTGGSCANPMVAEYTTSSGPGSETVRLDAGNELYVVDWHTDQFALDVTQTYRIQVSVGSTELGHADVLLARNGAQLKNLTSNTHVRLVNGRTLPIKFRIEVGALGDWQLTGLPPQSAQGGVTAFAVNAADHLFLAVQGGNAGSTGPGLLRSTDSGATWLTLNSGLTNTNVKGVTIPANGDVYVGTHGAGVWRSTDNGLHWGQTALTDGFIQIMFSRGSSIYALDGFSCAGVFRSRDDGVTWTTLNNGLAPCVNGIAVNASGDVFVATGTSGVFRSTDDGATWSPVNNGLGSSNLTGVVAGPTGDLYVGTVGAGVYRSPNNGDSWTAVNNGLPAQALVQGLGVSAGGTLLAGVAGVPGVFRSTDGGNSWLPFNAGLVTQGGIGPIGFQYSGHAVVSDGLQVWRSTSPLP